MDATNILKEQHKDEEILVEEKKDLIQQNVFSDPLQAREQKSASNNQVPMEVLLKEQDLENNLLELKRNVDLKEMIRGLTENSEGASGTSQEVLCALTQLDKRLDAHKEGDRNSLTLCGESLFRLQEALRSYKPNHTGIIWFSGRGEMRRELTKIVDEQVSPYIQRAVEIVGEADPMPLPEMYDEEQAKKVDKSYMKKIRESITDMCTAIGKDLLSTPETKLKKRLLLFETVKEDMMMYKFLHEAKFDDKMKAFYA